MIGYVMHTDGGARGNPGPAAIGVVIEYPQNNIHEISKYIGIATNNIAEYEAVLAGLEWISEQKIEISEVHIYLDSQLVARQLSGIYRIKNTDLVRIYTRIKEMENKIKTSVMYHEIPRDQNKRADFLVNKALDSR